MIVTVNMKQLILIDGELHIEDLADSDGEEAD